MIKFEMILKRDCDERFSSLCWWEEKKIEIWDVKILRLRTRFCMYEYVFVKQTFNCQFIFFMLFSSYYSFYQLLDEQCFDVCLFVLFLILYINVLFFLSSFNCLCWFRLMNFASSIVVASFFNLLLVFVVAVYDLIVVVVLLMFCSMLLNFLFISLNFTFIAFFTISVDSNTITRRSSDNCKLESIMFTVLSRNKDCISFLFELFDWIEINLRMHSVFSRRRRDVCLATT